jgi:hypothetical protein
MQQPAIHLRLVQGVARGYRNGLPLADMASSGRGSVLVGDEHSERFRRAMRSMGVARSR